VQSALGRLLPGGHIIVSDTCLLEMMKGPTWEYVSTRTLAPLSAVPAQVSVSLGVGELMRRELQSGVPTTDIVDAEVTPQFRGLMLDLQRGRGPVLDQTRQLISAAQAQTQQHQLNGPVNKGRVVRMIGVLKSLLSSAELAALRRHGTSETDGAEGQAIVDGILSAPALIGAVTENLAKDGLAPADVLERLAVGPSVLAHTWLSAAALALDWISSDGFSGAAESKFTNDQCDMDNAVLGLTCAEFITDDRKARRIFGDLQRAVATRAKALGAGRQVIVRSLELGRRGGAVRPEPRH
jgi:hypothetical protein